VAAHLPYCGCLTVLLALTRAVLRNEALQLDAYAHQLLPALLTCVVAKGIGGSVGSIHGPCGVWCVVHSATQRALLTVCIQSILPPLSAVYKSLPALYQGLLHIACVRLSFAIWKYGRVDRQGGAHPAVHNAAVLQTLS
jgi:hypothetical protein